MQQVKQPGKLHKAEHYAVAQLPIHPQYLAAGTVYFAELQEPLDFGVEPLTPEMVASLGAAPPPGSFVRTLLDHSSQFRHHSERSAGGSDPFAAAI